LSGRDFEDLSRFDRQEHNFVDLNNVHPNKGTKKDCLLGFFSNQIHSDLRTAMILAIFISCMGLFGLALFTAQRKTAEISIRKVLGATRVDILALLNKGFVGLILLSLVIASPIAFWLTHRWLEEFAYRRPIDWWVFPLAGAGAILIALITVSSQSIRAAATNPVKGLQWE